MLVAKLQRSSLSNKRDTKIMKTIYWIGAILGMLVFLWPRIYALRYSQYSEAELIEISPKFKGINHIFLKYVVLWALFPIPLLLLLVWILQSRQSDLVYLVMLAFVTVVFSGASLLIGLFARQNGVYPTSKYFGSKTSYSYADNDSLKRLGGIQVYASTTIVILALIVISILMIIM